MKPFFLAVTFGLVAVGCVAETSTPPENDPAAAVEPLPEPGVRVKTTTARTSGNATEPIEISYETFEIKK